MIRVLALGCFDGLHFGHVMHLKAAKALGDKLIVAVTIDDFVNKGPGRPVFPIQERAKMLWELRCVDQVIFNTYTPATIKKVRPDIFVKGKEYEGNLQEQAFVESLGGRVVFLDTEPVYSSTELLTGRYLNERIGLHQKG